MAAFTRSWGAWAAIGFLFLSACGLGRQQEGDGVITDPVVAATVNGRPIYIEDVRNYAVQTGRLREGEDLDSNSDAFFIALEEMIEVRLFATEAESQGLDREPDIRRRLQLARERVLATAIYEELQQKASEPRAVERAYRDNISRLGEGQEVHLRHIQFETRDAALAAKRRLDNGERFEVLAFEVSTDRRTAAEGGDLGFTQMDSLPEPMRQLAESTAVGEIGGPVRSEVGWHLVRVEDRRQRGAPSIESLRPAIVNWLTFQEIQSLRERLENESRIERLREPDTGVDAGGNVTAPADTPAPAPAPATGAPATGVAPPADVAAAVPSEPMPPSARPGARQAPPFPFPMGPGGVFSSRTPAAETPAPSVAPGTPSNPAPGAARPTPPAAGGATPATPRPRPPAQPAGATPAPAQGGGVAAPTP